MEALPRTDHPRFLVYRRPTSGTAQPRIEERSFEEEAAATALHWWTIPDRIMAVP
jgi:hypothetical protein